MKDNIGELGRRAGSVAPHPTTQGDDEEEKTDKYSQETDDNKLVQWHPVKAVPVPAVPTIVICRCTTFGDSFVDTIFVVLIVNIQH